MGKHAQKITGKLPDAANPKGKIKGNGKSLRVATIGESTVAGVGVEDHKDGVTYHLSKQLNEVGGYTVEWEATGGSGFNVDRVKNELVPKFRSKHPQLDVVVIMLGGNDTFELRSPMTWRKGMIGLLRSLKEAYPDAVIIIANLPPVKNFTSFNPVLQWYLGGLVDLHRNVIYDLPEMFPGVVYMSQEIDFDAWMRKVGKEVPMKEFFSDGVHPSELTYRLWGQQIAERVIRSIDQNS